MNKHFIICVLTAIAVFPQAQTPFTITQSAGSATGEIRMQERRTNGTDYVGLKAPQSVAASTVWTLPAADGTSGQCLQTDGAGVLSFAACAGYWTLSGSDIYRSTGVVTIGHTSPTVRLGQNLNTNYAGDFGGMAMNVFSATGGHGAVLDFNKSASGTLGSHGAVASGDTLGFIVFRGSDGTNYQRAAQVIGEVDGTVSSGVVPGRIRFRTADASGTMTERWRIDKSGHLTAGTNNAWNIGGGFSIGVGSGNPAAIYAESKLASRKLTLYDNTGSIAVPGEWDLNAVASGVGAAAMSNFYIRNNAGSNMLKIEAVNGGGTVDRSIFYTDIIPDAANTRKVGTSAVPFSQVNATSANFSALTIPTGSSAGYVWTDQGSGVGAWAEGGRDAYDVRNFGAVCDGTTDDTTAITNAINAGSGVKKRAILPQGVCVVTTINITASYAGLRGQGRRNSTLKSTTNAPVIKIDNAGPVYYLEFSDFTIQGNGAGTSQNGIESATAGFGVSTIHDIYFDGMWRGVKLGHTTDLGDNNILDCAFSMSVTNSVGIESLHTSSGSIWSRNFFGGTAEALGATSGNRAFYIHGYVGDTVLNDNHMEGGWIGFDISCDNGTFATGICSYGENLVIVGNKIDGYALDFRFYNLHNSTVTNNRGRGVLDAQITGTSTKGMIYDVIGRTDTGSAIERAGLKFTTTYGDVAINAYDEGRIRIGDTSSDLSATKNGISILDASYSSAVALGQSASRNMGMFWTRAATPSDAYGVIYTYGYSNGLLYGASLHRFTGGKVYADGNGPALGAGQNISNVWANGASGFVSLGVYRTDDTNGGWLIGTSAVSVGDFAIYQNQGAGTPAKRFLIDTSGTVDIPGNLSVAVMNATGSPAYRVSGTTVINSSREILNIAGVSTAWTPTANNTYVSGTSSLRWADVESVLGNFSGVLTAGGGVAFGASSTFSADQTYDFGTSSARARRLYATGWTTYGSSFASSGSSITIQTGATFTDGRTCALGDVWTSDASGNLACAASTASQWTTSGGNIYRSTGAVWIGGSANNTGAKLQVENSASVNILQVKYTGAVSSISGGGIIAHQGSAPTASGDRIGFLVFGAEISGTQYNRAAITAKASQAWSLGSAEGAYLEFATNSNGAATRTARWTIEHDGHFVPVANTSYTIGTTSLRPSKVWTSALDASGAVNFSGSTVTASSTFSSDLIATTNATYALGSSGVRWLGYLSTLNVSSTFTFNGTLTGDMIPTTNNTYISGSSSAYWNAIHGGAITAYTSFVPGSGVTTVDVGSATRRIRKMYTTDIDITGTVTPPSGTAFTGTKTVRDSAGTGTCTLTFSAGIMTGGTC